MLREKIHFLEALCDGKAPCSVADNHYVIGAFHHGLGQLRDVLDTANARHRARAPCRPMHDAGVELDFTFLVGQTAVADRIVVRIVLDYRHGGDGSVERVSSALKNVHAFLQCVDAVRARNHHGPFGLVRGGLA
jgi:hypothetical protein